ncbi:MAG: 2OG-Fe(II) oxygenase [Cyclobacteriaceae bacterium]
MDNTFHKFDQIIDSLVENNYAVIDDFINKEEAGVLKNSMFHRNGTGDFKVAGIGSNHLHQVNRKIRGDSISWIDWETALEPTRNYLNKVKDLMQYLNRTCYLGLKDFEAHFAVYPPGSFYKRHLDQFRHNDHRKITFITYLNHDWQEEDGGEICLYIPTEKGEQSVKFLPEAGRFLLFKSNLLEHEVKITQRERYSITGWMLDQVQDLTFL